MTGLQNFASNWFMKNFFIFFCLFFSTTYGNGAGMTDLTKFIAQVPTAEIDLEVARLLANEISYTDSFISNYVLVEYREASSGNIWYVLDGYFTLRDKTILFLDFDYDPFKKTWKAINNYAFVPEENKRFLLKADELCNPFKRHFIGVVVVGFKEPGHLDDIISFLGKTLNASPMLYTDGTNHMIQDLTMAMGSKPLFTLHEETLMNKLNSLSYVKDSMIIPSGRRPSDESISQTYEAVTSGCR